MIAHENIVEILDFGQTADGQPYFIMEYLTGRVAERRDRARRLRRPSWSRRSPSRCAAALAAAHAKGIVHRDLKPAQHVARRRKADGALR